MDESTPSPRLPQELIDLVIECIPTQDLTTLQACALASTHFRPRAQQAIFSDIALRSDNLATMHECFSKSTFAQFVRSLAINAMEIAFDNEIAALLPVIALLESPRRQDLTNPLSSVNASHISSLHITMLSLPTFLDHLHILFAFPKLHQLSLVRVRWGTSDPPAENAFLATVAPLQLDSLAIRFCAVAPLLNVLCPAADAAPFRSLRLDHYDFISPVWPQLVQRTGAHLEELEVWPFYGGACTCQTQIFRDNRT